MNVKQISGGPGGVRPEVQEKGKARVQEGLFKGGKIVWDNASLKQKIATSKTGRALGLYKNEYKNLVEAFKAHCIEVFGPGVGKGAIKKLETQLKDREVRGRFDEPDIDHIKQSVREYVFKHTDIEKRGLAGGASTNVAKVEEGQAGRIEVSGKRLFDRSGEVGEKIR